jgi:hypothetical protein
MSAKNSVKMIGNLNNKLMNSLQQKLKESIRKLANLKISILK